MVTMILERKEFNSYLEDKDSKKTFLTPYSDKSNYLRRIQKRLGRLRKKAGLPETVVFHSLRKTFVTCIENLGVSKNHISQLMGHEDGNMALDVYY